MAVAAAMAGARRLTPRLLGLLLVSSSCLTLAAAELSSSAEVSQQGEVCGTVKQMVEKGEMPSDVYTLMLASETMEEYKNLISALVLAKRGTMNVLKCSALYRTMYIGGHEEAFRKKDMSIFLTKQDKDGPFAALRKSLIQICFVKGAAAKPPEHIYHDAREIEVKGEQLTRTKTFPEGAVGQPYTDVEGKPLILADKSTMPVDVLKMLEAKDAMMLHMDMASLINFRKFSPAHTAEIVKQFEDRFTAKQLGVVFRTKVLVESFTQLDGHRYRVAEDVFWLEYVDLDSGLSVNQLQAIP